MGTQKEGAGEKLHTQMLIHAEEGHHLLGACLGTTESNNAEWKPMTRQRATENIELWRVTPGQSKRSWVGLKASGTLAHWAYCRFLPTRIHEGFPAGMLNVPKCEVPGSFSTGHNVPASKSEWMSEFERLIMKWLFFTSQSKDSNVWRNWIHLEFKNSLKCKLHSLRTLAHIFLDREPRHPNLVIIVLHKVVGSRVQGE